MTTQDVETLANRGNLARADFDLKFVLRRIVLPRFLLDVDAVAGRVWWRRKLLSLSFAPGDRQKDLPADFDRFDEVFWEENGQISARLQYIGEHPEKIVRAEAVSTSGFPAEYYIVPSSSGAPVHAAIRMALPLDRAATLRGVYYLRVPVADDVSAIHLDPYIPAQYQGALVHLLRSELLRDRFGIDDPRAQYETAAYERALAQLELTKEPAQRSRAVFVR